MSRMPLNAVLGALLVVGISAPAAAAPAQLPTHVRVVKDHAPVQWWLRPSDVLLEIEAGTTLEVLAEENGRYWVMLPRDANGTQRAGWIRIDSVEPFTPPAREPAPAAAPPSAAAPATTDAAEDKVKITAHDDATKTAAAAKVYTFEDVHFDRDRFALRPTDMDILRTAAEALKGDPSLVVTIEGYTCNLGATAYNRVLGEKRADAVKAWLVSQGIASDRLHIVSLGEQHPKHDNAREETRRLNRRVALVPEAPR